MRFFIFLFFILPIMTVCAEQNPLLKKFNTPFGVPPFSLIKTEHYEPAVNRAITEHEKEVEGILHQRSLPTFENTIEALECSGQRLNTAVSIFYALNSAESDDKMMEIAIKLSSTLAIHSNKINSNEELFERIKFVYDKREDLQLNDEKKELLETTYRGFVDGGANLKGEQRAEYDKLSIRLSELTTLFGQNVLKATNKYQKPIDDIELLSGLPETEIVQAAERAKRKMLSGWLLDLSAPCYMAVMKYANNRELRKELYMAYQTKCSSGDEFDNQKATIEIINTRLTIAKLLGYSSYAEYTLRRKMAETPANVNQLLDRLYSAYVPVAKEEIAILKGYAIGREGGDFEIMPWDNAYYSNKLKENRYSYNAEELRPYFELSNVTTQVFALASRLYGIEFKENKKLPVYHPEAQAFEVIDQNKKVIAILYTDFFPREGKRPGAWMTSFREQSKREDERILPIVSIVMNFSRPTSSQPALLDYSEVETFLHEFGHALHGIFADTQYSSLSGTNVHRDFVELPSQIMENWLKEEAFLNSIAVHYQTGDKLSPITIERIKASENFMVANTCLRQLFFGRLDMAYHEFSQPFNQNILAFEDSIKFKTVVTHELPNIGISTHFSHIFAGGYAAGYYSYKWAEVLDADAFSVFKQNGIFDSKTAQSFRTNILSKGGTKNPMVLYKQFRGCEPDIQAMMVRDGIVESPIR